MTIDRVFTTVRMQVVLIEEHGVTLKQNGIYPDGSAGPPITIMLGGGQGIEIGGDTTPIAQLFVDEIRFSASSLVRRLMRIDSAPAAVALLRIHDPITDRNMTTVYCRGDAIDLTPTDEGLGFELRGSMGMRDV